MSLEFLNQAAIGAIAASSVSLIFPLIKDWLSRFISRFTDKDRTITITIKVEKNGGTKEIVIKTSRVGGLKAKDIERIITESGGADNVKQVISE